MKQDEKSLSTKRALAASLKKLMEKKPLSKITVSEIITDCNVNRKTFYYHFEDIYDLLRWILEEEAIEVVKKFDLLMDYQEALSFVIDYVETNKHIINCAYDSLGREGMKHFLYADFAGIVWMLIEGFEERLDVHVNESFKKFLCEFYTEALSGMLINWFRDKGSSGKAVRDREQVIQDILLIFSSSLPNILKTYHAEKQI